MSRRELVQKVDRGLGWAVAAVLIATWVALLILVLVGLFTYDVAFFVAGLALAAAVSLVSLYAAARLFDHQRLRRTDSLPNLLPVPPWLASYARYLTPVGFVVGIVFGHYFWH